jgi:hypothetical protein
VVVEGIPTGTVCLFTEVDIPPQWILGGVASNEVVIEGTELVSIDAVNVRRVGELVITKRTTSPVPGPVSFDLALDCADDVFDTAVPVDVPARTTSVTETFSGIPTGVACRVAETALPSGWSLVSIQPASATVGEIPSTIVVTNTPARPLPPDPGEPSGSGSSAGGGLTLPDNGGPPVWLLWFAVALIVTGAGSVAASRRARDT